jgi:hypothetical protein
MRLSTAAFCLFLAPAALAQDAYKVSELKQGPPEAVSAPVRASLIDQGYRIQDPQGRPFLDFWLRKEIPASAKPAGASDAIQFPFLADGELLGVMQIVSQGHDYRDQPIAKGVYTMRYGLQPVNGDHLGVSPFRDYSLLLPAAKDPEVAAPVRKQLEERSAASAGTSHPAVFLLLEAPPDSSKSNAAMTHDAEKNLWSVVVPLSLKLKGEGQPLNFPVRLVVVGAAAP